MVEPEALALAGPDQFGRGVRGRACVLLFRLDTSLPRSLPYQYQSTITRPKCPRHTKNHHFRAGNCWGNCCFLNKKLSLSFKYQQSPEQSPALKSWCFVCLGQFGRVIVDSHSSTGDPVSMCRRLCLFVCPRPPRTAQPLPSRLRLPVALLRTVHLVSFALHTACLILFQEWLRPSPDNIVL